MPQCVGDFKGWDFDCDDFFCYVCLHFICCPLCGNPHLIRLGPVGHATGPDSRRFRCVPCRYTFSSMGETLAESMGRHR